MSQFERDYLALLERVLMEGGQRATRNGSTLSCFGGQIVMDVRNEGFPLITTKRVFFRGVCEELFWFLRGCFDANELSAKGVKIWDANTSREFLDSRGLRKYMVGECGPFYSFQWRAFGGRYPFRVEGVDQIRYIIEELKRDPCSRRAMLSAWNPQQLDQMCLPPCHVSYQFYLGEHGISCHMYQRSVDLACGLPFNMASTALFTQLIGHILGVPVDRVIISMGDMHIYTEHIPGIREQLKREPFPLGRVQILRHRPIATIDKELCWLETLGFDDIALEGYKCHPAIPFEMKA